MTCEPDLAQLGVGLRHSAFMNGPLEVIVEALVGVPLGSPTGQLEQLQPVRVTGHPRLHVPIPVRLQPVQNRKILPAVVRNKRFRNTMNRAGSRVPRFGAIGVWKAGRTGAGTWRSEKTKAQRYRVSRPRIWRRFGVWRCRYSSRREPRGAAEPDERGRGGVTSSS